MKKIFFVFGLFNNHVIMNQKRKKVNNEATLKKRKVLTFGEKKELCLLHNENPSLSQEEIGKKFGVKKNTVCDILKNKEKWLNKFKKRHNIKQYNKHGEAQSGPSEEELIKEREKLQELISNFDLEDVFNCDETGDH